MEDKQFAMLYPGFLHAQSGWNERDEHDRES